MVVRGVNCPKCKGERYKITAYLVGGTLQEVKTVCGECNGEGVIRYQGPREGVAWERE